jgi:hypothetical protein
MTLFRTAKAVALLALASAGLSSCLSPPDFPETPVIEFKELRKIHVAGTPGPPRKTSVDTLVFVLNFQDGDGDLGLGGVNGLPSDADAPYLEFDANGRRLRNGSNYHIQPFYKNPNNGLFEPYFSSPPGGQPGRPGEFDGRYPRLTKPDEKPAPIKGELVYKFPAQLDGSVFDGNFYAGLQLYFEISIKDRALNESNKITTPVVTLGP